MNFYIYDISPYMKSLGITYADSEQYNDYHLVCELYVESHYGEPIEIIINDFTGVCSALGLPS